MTISKDNFLEIFSWDLQMFNFDTDIKMQPEKLQSIFVIKDNFKKSHFKNYLNIG